MEEHHDLPMRMPGEELRLELRNAGMLENSEMIYAIRHICLAEKVVQPVVHPHTPSLINSQ